MKKPAPMELPVHDEPQPIKVSREDVTPKSGFILEVDGRRKNHFESESDARAAAVQLKARFPMLQIKIYDAVARTRSVVSIATDDPVVAENGASS
jgi:hypothetical protein